MSGNCLDWQTTVERLIKTQGGAEKLAERLGVSMQTVWRWRNKGVKRLSIKVRAKVAGLLDGVPPPPPEKTTKTGAVPAEREALKAAVADLLAVYGFSFARLGRRLRISPQVLRRIHQGAGIYHSIRVRGEIMKAAGMVRSGSKGHYAPETLPHAPLPWHGALMQTPALASAVNLALQELFQGDALKMARMLSVPLATLRGIIRNEGRWRKASVAERLSRACGSLEHTQRKIIVQADWDKLVLNRPITVDNAGPAASSAAPVQQDAAPASEAPAAALNYRVPGAAAEKQNPPLLVEGTPVWRCLKCGAVISKIEYDCTADKLVLACDRCKYRWLETTLDKK